MDWMFKPQKKQQRKSKSPNKNVYLRESRRLKFCETCKKVWEVAHQKKILRYDHLPTYGLIRKKCNMCVANEK